MTTDDTNGKRLDIKPIETRYKGYRFRSRLEARWAVFFDALKIEWTYEPEGFDLGDAGWYLPDFWLPEWKCFVEIKPDVPTDEEMAKFAALVIARRKTYSDLKEHYLICGSPGVPKLKFLVDGDRLFSVASGYVCLAVTGLLAEGVPDFTVSCFAMVDGGKALDIWPIYMTDEFVALPCEVAAKNIKGNHSDLWSVSLVGGPMRRLYAGKGIEYDSMPLRMAYTAARSARFEHGESPR